MFTETFKHDKNSRNLSHDQIKSLFCEIVNVVRPDHPYIDDPYPIQPENIRYSYKTASSSLYASCGPLNVLDYKVQFQADRHYFNHVTPNRLLAILVHEMTHITVGTHSTEEGGSHPPRFFREFSFNAHIILDHWEYITDILPNIDKEGFIGSIIASEINPNNIDKRYGSVEDRKHEMAKWFNTTLRHERRC